MLLHGLLRPEGGLYITISTSIALDINSTLMTPWFPKKPRDEAQDNDYDDPRDDDYDDHRHAHDDELDLTSPGPAQCGCRAPCHHPLDRNCTCHHCHHNRHQIIIVIIIIIIAL